MSYDGRSVEYRGTAEIARAIADLERELQAAQGKAPARQSNPSPTGLGEIAPTTQARQGYRRGHRQQERADRLGHSGAWRSSRHGHTDLNSGGVSLLSPTARVK